MIVETARRPKPVGALFKTIPQHVQETKAMKLEVRHQKGPTCNSGVFFAKSRVRKAACSTAFTPTTRLKVRYSGDILRKNLIGSKKTRAGNREETARAAAPAVHAEMLRYYEDPRPDVGNMHPWAFVWTGFISRIKTLCSTVLPVRPRCIRGSRGVFSPARRKNAHESRRRRF